MTVCTYSTISPEWLLTSEVPNYAISAVIDCQLWEHGASDTYKLRCASHEYFLRVYRSGTYTREANEFEAAFLADMHQKGVAVAYPVLKKTGDYISVIDAPEGERHVLISASVPGDVPDFDDEEVCQTVGEAVARLHTAADAFSTTRQRHKLDLAWLLLESLITLRDYFSDYSTVLTTLDSVAE